MSKSKVEELNKSAERARDAHQRHIASLQAEKKRVEALLPVSARERRQKWGPSVEDLNMVIDAAIEASDPLRGAPNEDTMRVGRPSSEGDEGASTRRMREKSNALRRDISLLAARYAVIFGVELPEHRDFGSHVRWHVDRQRTDDACHYCLGEMSA